MSFRKYLKEEKIEKLTDDEKEDLGEKYDIEEYEEEDLNIINTIIKEFELDWIDVNLDDVMKNYIEYKENKEEDNEDMRHALVHMMTSLGLSTNTKEEMVAFENFIKNIA